LAGREALTELYLAGYSMSGNMVLRVAADYGADFPRALKGVAAVSPSIDLDSCAAAMERRGNAVYRWNFVSNLRSRVRRRSRLRPGQYDTRRLRRVRTIRQFDEHFTAPHGGFRDADDYYARASSRTVLKEIRVPTLIIHAADDPLIPVEPFLDRDIADNPDVLLVLTRRGGHVGFLSDRAEGEDRHWAENRVVEFFNRLRE
jgi:predicted alpha/beta-fold hydrolase